MTHAPAPDTQRTVRLRRRFDAAPEDVFRAWTDPVEVAEWYGPDGWHAPVDRIRIDDAVGGRWEVTMVRRADGLEFPIGYEIVERVEARLIVLRYTDTSSDGAAEPTMVRVELTPDGDGTIITLTDGPMPVEGRDSAEGGYQQAFDKLAARLGITRPNG